MIDKEIRNYILAQSEITDLIGQRLYTEIAPLDASFPFIVMNRVSNFKNKYSKIFSPVYQFSCFSKINMESDTILIEVNNKLEDYFGMFSTVSILDINYEDIVRMPFDNDKKVFQSILEIRIFHK